MKETAYDDIINLQPPKHPCRKPMSMNNRAAQFAPFSALTGFEETIDRHARLPR